jgi:hypothetical protein
MFALFGIFKCRCANGTFFQLLLKVKIHGMANIYTIRFLILLKNA